MTAADGTQPRIIARDGIIALSGRIDSRITGELMDAYIRMDKADEVRLDFSETEQVDVSGLNALIKLYGLAKTGNRRLKAAGLSPLLRDVFKASCIDEAIVPEPPGCPADAGSKPENVPWAAPAGRLSVAHVPEGAVSLNVDGFGVAGPVQGFGRLWEKTYRMRLAGIDAGTRDVITALKENFPRFQPAQNRFYPLPAGIAPGEIVLINASTPAGPLYTGVRVLYADDESFTFMTPQGHPEAGWVSFSAYEEEGAVIARVQGFARASDPLYELGFELMGAREQERIWKHVLSSLGRHFGIEGYVSVEKSCVGNDYQWERAGNVRHNAQIRSMGYALMKLMGF